MRVCLESLPKIWVNKDEKLGTLQQSTRVTTPDPPLFIYYLFCMCVSVGVPAYVSGSTRTQSAPRTLEQTEHTDMHL